MALTRVNERIGWAVHVVVLINVEKIESKNEASDQCHGIVHLACYSAVISERKVDILTRRIKSMVRCTWWCCGSE